MVNSVPSYSHIIMYYSLVQKLFRSLQPVLKKKLTRIVKVLVKGECHIFLSEMDDDELNIR